MREYLSAIDSTNAAMFSAAHRIMRRVGNRRFVRRDFCGPQPHAH
jgi:hypothetical protein